MAGIDTKLGGAAALAAVMLFLTTTMTVLRLIARYKFKNKFWADDYTALAAWIGVVGMASAFIYGMSIKFIGYPEPKSKAVVAAQHPTIELVFLTMDFLGVWALGMTKLSALFFYRRIFCTKVQRNFFDYLTIVFIVIMAAWIVTFGIMTFNLCGSHSTVTWGIQPQHTASCELTFPYFEGLTISDFILDVLILSMAFPVTWRLNMSVSRKIAISGIFLLAFAGVGASCARMIINIKTIKLGRSTDGEDGYQINTQTQYYALLEAGLSLVCVNIPSLHCFVAGIRPEGLFRSVRSFISIGSRPSQGSMNSTKAGFSHSKIHNSSSGIELSALAKTEPQVLESFDEERPGSHAM